MPELYQEIVQNFRQFNASEREGSRVWIRRQRAEQLQKPLAHRISRSGP